MNSLLPNWQFLHCDCPLPSWYFKIGWKPLSRKSMIVLSVNIINIKIMTIWASETSGIGGGLWLHINTIDGRHTLTLLVHGQGIALDYWHLLHCICAMLTSWWSDFIALFCDQNIQCAELTPSICRMHFIETITKEKIIKTSKQSASTCGQCNISGNRNQPATYGDLSLKPKN